MEKLGWFEMIVLGFCFRAGWDLLGLGITFVEKIIAAHRSGQGAAK